MAPKRKSTSKKKAVTSASSRVHKRLRVGAVPSNGVPAPSVSMYNDDGTAAFSSCPNYLGRTGSEDSYFDEVIVVDDDDPSDSTRDVIDLTQDSELDTPMEKKDIFPFLKLPSEIRYHIYLELIPSGYDIFYDPRNQYTRSRSMITARDKNGTVYSSWVGRQVKEPRADGGYRVRVVSNELRFPPVALNLFLANKVICNEARAVLYGGNTFNFNINAVPKKYDRTNVFGFFEGPATRHLLRELRLITLHVDVNDGSPLAIKRHRQRLQQFTQELQKHSHDSEQKSLLKKIKVEWFTTSLARHSHRFTGNGRNHVIPRGTGIPNAAIRIMHEDQKQYIFGLEGLTELSGVDEVEITGAHVPPWFLECLTRCLKGSAKAPPPINYPELVVKRKSRDKGNGARRTYKYVAVSTKKWCDPWLNWTEFVDRERIEVPEVDRLMLQGLRC